MKYYQFTTEENDLLNNIANTINQTQSRPPSSLYRYMRLCDENVKNLCEGKIHITAAKDMSDKLDFSYPISISPSDMEKVLMYYIEEIPNQKISKKELVKSTICKYEEYASNTDALSVKNRFHIACFTTSCLNDFMWDRYSGGHSGICCEYSITNELFRTNLFTVVYADKTTVENFLGLIKNKTIKANEELNIFDLIYGIRKNPCWRHEDEYRLIMPFLDSEEHTVIDGFKPKSITLGSDWYKLDENTKKALLYKKIFEYCAETKTALYILITNYKELKHERNRII